MFQWSFTLEVQFVVFLIEGGYNISLCFYMVTQFDIDGQSLVKLSLESLMEIWNVLFCLIIKF